MCVVPRQFWETDETDFRLNSSKMSISPKTIFAIHTLSPKLKERLRIETHHYCDIFTKILFTPLPSKVFIGNIEHEVRKDKRVLIVSYDGKLNLWQCAPSFESSKNYISETLITDSKENIVSIVTGSQNGRYAISCFDGYSGKFETKRDWKTVDGENGIIYGDRTFGSREELWQYLEGKQLGKEVDLQAIVVKAPIPRIILFDLLSGLEVSHSYIRGDFDVAVCDKYR